MTFSLVEYIILISIIALSSCKSNISRVADVSAIKIKAYDLLKKEIECIVSDDSMHYLCIADDDPRGDPLRKVYVVYDYEGNLIIDPMRIHGQVNWFSKDQIELIEYSRVINKTEDTQPKRTIVDINQESKKRKE
jgi:hypothetical protein